MENIIKTKKLPISNFLKEVSPQYEKPHIIYDRITHTFYYSDSHIKDGVFWHFTTNLTPFEEAVDFLNFNKFKYYNNIDKFLKQKIITTIKEIYINS